MGLKFSYTLIAPIYDAVVASATHSMRKDSLRRLDSEQPLDILVNGIGTGLDIPHLPEHHRYHGIDLTPAMLKKCQQRLHENSLSMQLKQGDAMQLPYDDNHFDIVLMNLILAVVPDPLMALKEASRVVKPGGKVLIMDKFIRTEQPALLLRFANIFMRHIATRTDVIFEDLIDSVPQLIIKSDVPALFNGWFRLIDLEKKN